MAQPDKAHRETDDILKALEERIAAEYSRALVQIKGKLAEYLRRFRVKDEIKRRQLAAGEITKEYYDYWRKGQIIIGKRWEEMRDVLATDFVNTNLIIKDMVSETLPSVFAINHNYGTYQIEKSALVSTSYTLYSRETVLKLIRDNPKLLPDLRPGSELAKKIAINKDLQWNERKVQSAVLQGILQGEDMEQIAGRINSVAKMNHTAVVRYARTAVTGAENAGRQEAYKRAINLGIDTRNQWSATLDFRTRHSHRIIDGEIAEVGEKFSNGCIRPGDSNGPGSEIWNCRCSLVPFVEGMDKNLHPDSSKMGKLGNMSYEEWQQSRIILTRQEQKDWMKAGQPDLAEWYNSDKQKKLRSQRRKRAKARREKARKAAENNEQ